MKIMTAILAAALATMTALAPARAALPAADAKPWWKGAVIYEIYPRSFQDSNGDGLGDLNGITRRLNYLADLGVDAIWLTPINPSPQVDFGYDVSDYRAIDPRFGTMADFDRLVTEAGKRHIRVVMDLVLNHTSDQHEWFKQSRRSPSDPKRDWYIWRDGRAGGPPNNWNSIFGHSAWQYDPATKQYYLHQFLPQQPDLNWRNPAVETAMFDAARFWLDRGVAGFRLDAITTLFEDPQFRDAALTGGISNFGDPNQDRAMTDNLPEVHDVIKRLRKVADGYAGDRVLIGETYLPNVTELDRWYGANGDELTLPMDLQLGFADRFDAATLRARIADAETGIHRREPLYVFDNHDQRRSWDRLADGAHNDAIAKVVATILLASRDTAMIYYGEELGMPTTDPVRKEDVRDPNGITGWPKEKGRDGSRTPMQWDASANAGFSGAAKTWLPVRPSAATRNVEAEARDPASLLNWHKRLIALRRAYPALRDGDTRLMAIDDPHILAWERSAPGHAPVLVACNISAEPQTLHLARGEAAGRARVLLASADGAPTADVSALALAPYGVFIGELAR